MVQQVSDSWYDHEIQKIQPDAIAPAADSVFVNPHILPKKVDKNKNAGQDITTAEAQLARRQIANASQRPMVRPQDLPPTANNSSTGQVL